MIDWSDYPNFTVDEMRCRCGCGRADMDPEFMKALQKVRNNYGRPMVVNSAYRCPVYDTTIGGKGVHPSGRAADIKTAGPNAYLLLRCALERREPRPKMPLILGVGLKQHGLYSSRFIHLDTIDGPKRPRIWTYP